MYHVICCTGPCTVCVLGAVYPTNTKVITKNIGVEGLREVCIASELTIPVVAIGGIEGEEKVRACLVRGRASGIAVVSALFGQHDVQQATSSLLTIIKMVQKEI